MNQKFLITALIFFYLTSAKLLSADADRYWISFSGPRATDNPGAPAGPKYLMKIDMFGNVLIRATKVVANSSVFGSSPKYAATALTQGPPNSGRINLWFARNSKNLNYPIFKAIINKATLHLVSMGPTKLVTSNPATLPITQKLAKGQLVPENFIVLQVFNNPVPAPQELIAYSTSFYKTSWFLQDCVDNSCGFGVSADGKAFIYSKQSAKPNRHDLFFQTLGPRGRAVGDPEMVISGRNVAAADLTNSIQNSKRYLIYKEFGPSLFLQIVNAKTGQKIGEKIKIAHEIGGISSVGGNVAVDPRGRFIIYESANSSVSGSFLFYQALDATAHPSGSPKIIAEQFGSGVDILQD